MEQSNSPKDCILNLIKNISPSIFITACAESGLIRFIRPESLEAHVNEMTEFVAEAVWHKIAKEARLRI